MPTYLCHPKHRAIFDASGKVHALKTLSLERDGSGISMVAKCGVTGFAEPAFIPTNCPQCVRKNLDERPRTEEPQHP